MADGHRLDNRASTEVTSGDVLEHLRRQYAGVFTNEAIERHLRERVGMSEAEEMLEILKLRRPDAQRILDVGCGYGSFVLAARDAGLDAVGLELTAFELGWARARLAEKRPTDDPSVVYVQGDAGALPFAEGQFDAVTLWNVLEHVPDGGQALAEAARVLRQDGSLFVLAPNYAAIRREAHYQVPWPPLLPKPLAKLYLRALGKDPSFFANDVYPCTKFKTVRTLKALGFELREPRLEKVADPSLIEHAAVREWIRRLSRLHLLGLVRLAVRAQQLNPFGQAISFEAIKR